MRGNEVGSKGEKHENGGMQKGPYIRDACLIEYTGGYYPRHLLVLMRTI